MSERKYRQLAKRSAAVVLCFMAGACSMGTGAVGERKGADQPIAARDQGGVAQQENQPPQVEPPPQVQQQPQGQIVSSWDDIAKQVRRECGGKQACEAQALSLDTRPSQGPSQVPKRDAQRCSPDENLALGESFTAFSNCCQINETLDCCQCGGCPGAGIQYQIENETLQRLLVPPKPSKPKPGRTRPNQVRPNQVRP